MKMIISAKAFLKNLYKIQNIKLKIYLALPENILYSSLKTFNKSYV